jgi:hypothetical protein
LVPNTEDTLSTSEDTEDDVTDDEEDEEEDDPVKDAIAKAIEKARLEWEQDGQKRFDDERQKAERTSKARKEREAHETNLKNSFGDTVKEIRGKIKTLKIRGENGNLMDVNLSDEFL